MAGGVGHADRKSPRGAVKAGRKPGPALALKLITQTGLASVVSKLFTAREETWRRLFRGSGVNEPPHGRYAIRRNASPPCMFSDGVFVRSEVHTIDLVAGNVALQPLNLRPHSFENSQ